MKGNRYLTISEFSKISEVSRRALIFYDNIGLFSPEYTGENGYRYYSHEQIYSIFVINILKESGMSLQEIKAFLQGGTPKSAAMLLQKQGEAVAKKIQRLQGIQDMLRTRASRLAQAQAPAELHILRQEEQPLFLSDAIGLEKASLPDEAWLGFYMKCKKSGIVIGYPEGFLVSREDFLAGKTTLAAHIICHVGDTRYANGAMPAGNYLAAWGTGSFLDTEPIYRQIREYIAQHQLTVVGNAYEERLIDEVASREKSGQVIQIKVQIL